MFSILLFAVMGIFVGMVLPLQTVINTKLKFQINSVLLATTISCTVGAVFLLVFNSIIYRGNIFQFGLWKNNPSWLWIGGILGIGYLWINILIFPHIGSTNTVILPMIGQVVTGLLIDNFGWFKVTVRSLTGLRLLGALLVVVGAIYIVLKRGQNQWGKRISVIWSLLGIFSGILSSTQTAINGQLRLVLNSASQAAGVSFMVAALGLWIIVLIRQSPEHIFSAWNQSFKSKTWFGGLVGVPYTLGNAYLATKIGTGMTVIVVVVGTIVGGLLIDHLQSKTKLLELRSILSIVIMILGISLIQLN